MRRYNPELVDKQRIVAISKSDMLDDELQQMMKVELDATLNAPYLFISSVAQKGIQELKDVLWKQLNE